jgi:hypothetical protein
MWWGISSAPMAGSWLGNLSTPSAGAPFSGVAPANEAGPLRLVYDAGAAFGAQDLELAVGGIDKGVLLG